MKSRMFVFAAAVMLMCAGVRPVSAQEVKLKFVTLNLASEPFNTMMLHPWAERINEQGKGVLSIEVFDGYSIANYGNWYDRLVSDVVQIAFGTTGVGGRFKKVTAPQIPFLVSKSAPASLALWRLYKTGMLDNEFDQVMPLMLVVFPAIGPQYRREPNTIDSFAGLRVIGGSKVTDELIEALGGAPLSFPPAQQYEALQRGTADAILTNFSALKNFKLDEVTHYHVNIDLGAGVGMVAMSKARYNALPEAARRILAANATDRDSLGFGTWFDGYEQSTRETIAAAANQKIVSAPPEVAEKWQERARPIEEDWVKANDGAAVLAKYKQLLVEASAGH